LSERDISYSGYLEIPSYQLGEGQHHGAARGCLGLSACAGSSKCRYFFVVAEVNI